MATTTLYRYFGPDDILLYVGIAGRIGYRLEQHESGGAEWIQFVRKATFERFQTREAALAAESKAISDERPLCNVKRPGCATPPRWSIVHTPTGWEDGWYYRLEGLFDVLAYYRTEFPMWEGKFRIRLHTGKHERCGVRYGVLKAGKLQQLRDAIAAQEWQKVELLISPETTFAALESINKYLRRIGEKEVVRG